MTPMSPLRPCAHPHCVALVRSGYCDKHKRQANREDTVRRGTAWSRGYDRTWKEARAAYLAVNPWCVVCMERGVRVEATDVDHKVPHRGDKRLFWDRSNWQSLCHRCHSSKTAREDGRWKPNGREQ